MKGKSCEMKGGSHETPYISKCVTKKVNILQNWNITLTIAQQ